MPDAMRPDSARPLASFSGVSTALAIAAVPRACRSAS